MHAMRYYVLQGVSGLPVHFVAQSLVLNKDDQIKKGDFSGAGLCRQLDVRIQFVGSCQKEIPLFLRAGIHPEHIVYESLPQRGT